MEELPTELLEKIFLLLRRPDRLHAALVCKRWAEVVSYSRLLKDICLVFRERATPNLLDSHRQYTNLKICDRTLNYFHAEFWARIARDLVSLQLEDCDLSAEVFLAILGQCQKLQSLELTGCSSLMMSEGRYRRYEYIRVAGIQQSLRNVRHLSLRTNRFLTESSFNQMLTLMPNITSLCLAGWSDTIGIGSGVLVHMERSKQEFVDLDFTRTRITDKALIQIVKLYRESLTSLRLESCSRLTARACETIGECSKLRHLNLRYCYEMGKDSFGSLGALTKLQHLDLGFTNCDVKAFRQLTSLKDLRTLDLSYCVELDSECSVIICNNFKRLEKLNLRLTSALTDEAGCKFHQLKNLRSLNITGAGGISDRSFENGIGATDMNLLNIGHCSLLTDRALVSIANHHACLEYLDLRGCERITDVGLISAVRCLPRLRTLVLQKCRSLTDRSLHALQDHCPHLRELNVAACKTSRHAIHLFAQVRPNVNIIKYR